MTNKVTAQPVAPTVGSSAMENLHVPLLDRRNVEVVSPAETTASTIAEVLIKGGTVISEDYVSEFGRITAYEVFPEKIIDVSRSAHQVGFGRFIGRRPQKPSRPGNILSTATKPFKTPEIAANEAYGYWALSSIGVETFDPIGVFQQRSGDGCVVITKKCNDLMSLDRDTWIVGREVATEADVEIAERNTQTVKEISQTLAWLHMHGIFHKDGQIKNYAVASDGTVGVIDTENLSRRNVGDPDTGALMMQDIEKLMKSLVNTNKSEKIFGVGMLHGLSAPAMQASYEELVANPYSEGLMACVDLGGEDEQAQILMDSLWDHLKYAKTDNWPMCLDES